MSYSEFLQMLGVGDSPMTAQLYQSTLQGNSPYEMPVSAMSGSALETGNLGFDGGQAITQDQFYNQGGVAGYPIALGAGADPEGFELASQAFYENQDPELYSAMPFQSQPTTPVFNPGTDPALMQQASSKAALQNAQSAALYGGTDSAAMAGPEIMTAEAGAQGAAEAGGSSFGGPATFAGNMALNMIPTRDRDKVDTPLGDEGSVSGILKGAGKGALLGGTISGGNPYAIAGGALLGTLGGARGYFDSTSAPIMQVSRNKQNRGLLGGGGANLYG